MIGQPLNIPLSSSPQTRRYSRRVMRFIIGGLILFMGLFGGWRLWVTQDTTTTFGPKDAEMAIRIFKTPETVRILSEKLQGKQIISGIPLGIADMIRFTDRSFTVWISETGAVQGVTVDTAFPEEIALLVDQYGSRAHNASGQGFIGHTEGEERKENGSLARFWHRLFPWNDGEISYLSSHQSTPLRINTQGIALALHTQAPTIPDVHRFSNEIITKSDAVLSPDGERVDLLLSALALNGSNGELASAMPKGIRVLLGEDAQGDAAAILFPEGALTEAGAEMIARSMLAKTSLATQELTFKDGTSTTELRSDLTEIKKTIQENGTIVWENGKDQRVFLQRDQKNHLVIITNRELTSTNHAISHLSACLAHASSFTKTSLLHGTGTLLPWFDQIAWKNRTIKFCW